MTRTQILNYISNEFSYSKYLEIGVCKREHNINHITCPNKIGVDPDGNSGADFVITSDEFFKGNKEKFDLIFIDGLHEWEQVLRDVKNSLDALNENGTIVLHDCNPTSQQMQLVPRVQSEWTGDVWRAIVKLRQRNDLFMFTINTDYGCGVIRMGNQDSLTVDESELTYENFALNKTKWLNLIGVEEFKNVIQNEK